MTTPLIQPPRLLQPLFCAPKELKVRSFPQFYNLINPTTPLLQQHFYGRKVVVLVGIHCNKLIIFKK